MAWGLVPPGIICWGFESIERYRVSHTNRIYDISYEVAERVNSATTLLKTKIKNPANLRSDESDRSRGDSKWGAFSAAAHLRFREESGLPPDKIR